MTFEPNRGDRLVQAVIAGQGNLDVVANDLLDEFKSGYPYARLRPLLRNPSEAVLRIGVWIASEIGTGAAPMMDDIEALLKHPSRFVRFHALATILSSGRNEFTFHAISMIKDSDEAVRWKALQILSTLPSSILHSNLPRVEDHHLVELVKWLTTSRLETEDIISRMRQADPLGRLIAAVAAARIGNTDPTALQSGVASSHPEISSFCKTHLEGLALEEKILRRKQNRLARRN